MGKGLAFAIAMILDLILPAAILAKHWKRNHFAENSFFCDREREISFFDFKLKKQKHIQGFRQIREKIYRFFSVNSGKSHLILLCKEST